MRIKIFLGILGLFAIFALFLVSGIVHGTEEIKKQEMESSSLPAVTLFSGDDDDRNKDPRCEHEPNEPDPCNMS